MKPLLIFFFEIVAISSSALDSDGSFKTCINRRFESVVKTTTRARSRIHCAAACLKESCLTANFIKHENICEMFEEDQSAEECDSFVHTNGAALLTRTQTSLKTETMGTTEPTQTSLKTETMGTTEAVNPCKNNQMFDGTVCNCQSPLSGEFCEIGPRDCKEKALPFKDWFDIYPEDGAGKITVFCYGNRLHAFVAPLDGFATHCLNDSWVEHKNGFGDMKVAGMQSLAVGCYWLGNENIHRITSGILSYKLEYFFGASSGKVVGFYQYFRIAHAAGNYTVHYTSYTTSNNLDQTLVDGRPFSTRDRDTNGCAKAVNTGFWYDKDCANAPPVRGKY